MIGSNLGSYEIIEQVGKGGMANVYRAYQPAMDRYVAVKVIHPSILGDQAGRERFQREAKLIARLQHPHILPVHDFDGTHDPPYIVMRFLESGTLQDVLKRQHLPFDEIGYLLRQICSALDYAHRQGIIHRDVKPSNIMIDLDGNAFITDFGIARIKLDAEAWDDEDTITKTGSIVGTPDYMAPEQGLGEAGIDHRIDIYALGVMLYQLVTGEMPYQAPRAVQLIVKHIRDPIPSARDRNPEIPVALDSVIAKAMAKNPDQRFQSAIEFATATIDALGGSIAVMPRTLQAAAEETHYAVTADRGWDSSSVRTPTELSKLVSVLYVNAAEYAEMIEDIEGTHAALAAVNTLMDAFATQIEEFGGEIYAKDETSLLVLWGIKHTREDDPERALRTGLALRDTMRAFCQRYIPDDDEPLPIRMGIHTGSVLLTLNSEAQSYSASGATISLTQRFTQSAMGNLLATYDTYRLVQGVFDCVLDSQLKIRSRDEPIGLYRVLAIKSRPFRRTKRGVEGVETKLVGRESELKVLTDAYLVSFEDHETQVVTVIGAAGIGKSRLLYEYALWLDSSREERLWLFEGRATPETERRPYGLLRDLFAHRFEILETDTAAVVCEKMEQGVAGMVASGDTRMAHLLGHLSGFDFTGSPFVEALLDDPEQLNSQARQMFKAFFVKLATQQPVAILLEDVHWVDEASLVVINELVSNQPRLMLTVVCVARSLLDERFPTWGEGQPFHTRLELMPLAKRASRNLVYEILQNVVEIPTALRDMIVERSEGIPYYAEELVKTLIEDRVIVKYADRWVVEEGRFENVRIPPSLVGLLQVRLDGLLYPERVILQRASVVGRIFWDQAMIGLESADGLSIGDVEAVLARLAERELIHERPSSAFEGSTEYIVANNMLRDAVYENLLLHQRQAYHAATAEWLIANENERADEFTRLIADHFELAGQPKQAAPFWLEAGKKHYEMSAFQDAIAALERALELLPSDAILAQLEARITLEETHRRLRNFAIARRLAHEIHEIVRQESVHIAQAIDQRGTVELTRFKAAHQYLRETIRALVDLGNYSHHLQSFIQAETLYRQALTIALQVGNQEEIGKIEGCIGLISLDLNKVEDARQHFMSAMSVAYHHNMLQQSVEALIGYTAVACKTKQLADAAVFLGVIEATLSDGVDILSDYQRILDKIRAEVTATVDGAVNRSHPFELNQILSHILGDYDNT